MQYVIIGNNVYAAMLNDYLSEEPDKEVVAFSVEQQYIGANEFEHKPVVSYEQIEKQYLSSEVQLLMGVGYSQMNGIKEKLFHLYHKKGYQFATYQHPSAILSKDVRLGEGNIFFEGAIVQRGCVIGDGNVFFARTLVAHNCMIGNFNSFSFASLAGNVTIRDKCFAGMGSVIGENVTVESRVFIGANAYVNEDIKEGRVVLGEKGKIVDRDISGRIL